MADNEVGKGFTVTDRRAASGEGESTAHDATAAEATEAQSPAAEAGGPYALPQIDFGTFVMSLAQSVLIHLGELVVPGEDEGPDLPLAKQTIDLLGMLEEKTRGNLTDDEARLLQHLLFDLRLKFVEARKR